MEVNDRTFTQEVLNHPGKVLIDFWASWCPPCKMMEPLVKQLAEKYKNKARICSINVDMNQNSMLRYKILGVPTFILFIDGKEQKRLVGAQTEEALVNLLEGDD